MFVFHCLYISTCGRNTSNPPRKHFHLKQRMDVASKSIKEKTIALWYKWILYKIASTKAERNIMGSSKGAPNASLPPRIKVECGSQGGWHVAAEILGTFSSPQHVPIEICWDHGGGIDANLLGS